MDDITDALISANYTFPFSKLKTFVNSISLQLDMYMSSFAHHWNREIFTAGAFFNYLKGVVWKISRGKAHAPLFPLALLAAPQY